VRKTEVDQELYVVLKREILAAKYQLRSHRPTSEVSFQQLGTWVILKFFP
jgi:hypothetical protein